jgi:hypothetical protein
VARHPSTENLLHWLEPNKNLPAYLIWVPEAVEILAKGMVEQLPDSPELAAGLRKLLEAKDCFVRATLEAHRSGKEE